MDRAHQDRPIFVSDEDREAFAARVQRVFVRLVLAADGRPVDRVLSWCANP